MQIPLHLQEFVLRGSHHILLVGTILTPRTKRYWCHPETHMWTLVQSQAELEAAAAHLMSVLVYFRVTGFLLASPSPQCHKWQELQWGQEYCSFAFLYSCAQHFVSVFFRQIEKDKKETVWRKQSVPTRVTEMSAAPVSGGPGALYWSSCFMLNFTLHELLSSTKQHRAPLPSAQCAHENTQEKRAPPPAKSSLLSTLGSMGYTLGTASSPSSLNKAHWPYTHTVQHLRTRLPHFGYLIFFVFFKHTRITFKVLYKLTCWKSDVKEKLFKSWHVYYKKKPPKPLKTKQMFSLSPSLRNERVKK